MIQPSVDISETSSDVMVAAYVSNAILNDISLNVTFQSGVLEIRLPKADKDVRTRTTITYEMV